MDTQEKNNINVPLPKFEMEDSLFLNYINSLSPIKPVKSVQINQTFNSLSFSSLPSVFTSPHDNFHHKESRILRRHNLADATQSCRDSSELQENTDQRTSAWDATIEPSSKHTNFSMELPQSLKYNYDPLYCGDEANSIFDLPGEPASDVSYAHEGSLQDLVESAMHLQGICHSETKIEGPYREWGNLITNASYLSTFSSPNVTEALMGLMNKQLDPRPSNFASLPSSTSSLQPSASQVNPLLSVPASGERDLEPLENEVQPAKDYTLTSDFHQNTPIKKRYMLEPAGEGESCKRCRCKKSKCLKLYCECFAAGVYCVEPCSCQDCFNKPIHEDTVLQSRKQIKSRNALAFAPKLIRSSDCVPEIGDDPNKMPATARHKRGCNCKKSSCLKKYCECYQGGVGCSFSCRCEGCKNSYGRKNGKSPFKLPFQTVPDEDEPPITCIKISSPNGKRISSPNCDFGSSPTRRRKLILQSIPSFPSFFSLPSPLE